MPSRAGDTMHHSAGAVCDSTEVYQRNQEPVPRCYLAGVLCVILLKSTEGMLLPPCRFLNVGSTVVY